MVIMLIGQSCLTAFSNLILKEKVWYFGNVVFGNNDVILGHVFTKVGVAN